MNTLLQLNSSIFSNGGQSRRLADEFVAAWRTAHPSTRIIARDFALDPVPHLTAERFQSFLAKPEERNAEQQAVVAYSDTLIDELKRANVIVLGLPMYNFGVPSKPVIFPNPENTKINAISTRPASGPKRFNASISNPFLSK